MKKVVVVAPTYNEKGSIEECVKLILEQNGKVPGFEIHALVADSHSPDGTGEIVEKLAGNDKRAHFLDVKERGLGLAIVKGYDYALNKLDADVLMQIDADLQHDPNDIPKFLEKIDEGYDYVQGSRYVKGGSNDISLLRQIFSYGADVAMQILTGIWEIHDFTPSYKAYTKELFKKMDWDAIPWQGTTFIIQPAAVVEAKKAGAKMTEVPIKFRAREADKSKNQTFNYIIDVLGYAVEVRLSKWGIKLPILFWARRSKTFIKFGSVGLLGTIIDFAFYNIFIGIFGIPPATSKVFSTEIAIFNNFSLNNLWTFKKRKTNSPLWKKFITFNVVSLGGLLIGVGIIKFLHTTIGDGIWYFGPLHLQYYNLYFFATVPPVMVWNFLVNHFVTWKSIED